MILNMPGYQNVIARRCLAKQTQEILRPEKWAHDTPQILATRSMCVQQPPEGEKL
ncbi:hypothetical protein GWO43_00875 [candidate division KSB1 bacterium]|nr:hypothetical protein [candidate division KSB1 bacterium]NIR68992.1 hypothetical protein [candidate division KSB1 bacterium]NIS22614.1 hypothetical protein [candidate division KSB1 bacterium]NIT69474.1 hypothetical protein [candidate division KSB1 bacterium]NIU23129.1 hypothetical protein [candidate division KSB1 bacterium]